MIELKQILFFTQHTIAFSENIENIREYEGIRGLISCPVDQLEFEKAERLLSIRYLKNLNEVAISRWVKLSRETNGTSGVCNHTVILKVEDYKQIGAHPKSLDAFFKSEENAFQELREKFFENLRSGESEPIAIPVKRLSTEMDAKLCDDVLTNQKILISETSLRKCLNTFYNGKKIIVVNFYSPFSREHIAYVFLLFLPLTERATISIITLEPKRSLLSDLRDDYDVIVTDRIIDTKSGWEVISDSESTMQLRPLDSLQIYRERGCSGLQELFEIYEVGKREYSSASKFDLMQYSLAKLTDTKAPLAKMLGNFSEPKALNEILGLIPNCSEDELKPILSEAIQRSFKVNRTVEVLQTLIKTHPELINLHSVNEIISHLPNDVRDVAFTYLLEKYFLAHSVFSEFAVEVSKYSSLRGAFDNFVNAHIDDYFLQLPESLRDRYADSLLTFNDEAELSKLKMGEKSRLATIIKYTIETKIEEKKAGQNITRILKAANAIERIGATGVIEDEQARRLFDFFLALRYAIKKYKVSPREMGEILNTFTRLLTRPV